MPALLAAMLVMLESGSVPPRAAPQALFGARSQALSVEQPAGEGAVPLAAIAPAPEPLAPRRDLWTPGAPVHPHQLALALIARLAPDTPISSAAEWLATSGLSMNVTPHRVFISLRMRGL